MNKIVIVWPIPKRPCKCPFSGSTYCNYETPQLFPIHSDWSSEDWDGKKAKAREQESLIDSMAIKIGNDTLVTNKTSDRPKTKITDNLWKLTLSQDAEALEATNKLVPLPEVPEGTPGTEGVEDTDGTTMPKHKPTEPELQLQKEKEQYAIYISTFGYKEDSDMDMDGAAYPYLD